MGNLHILHSGHKIDGEILLRGVCYVHAGFVPFWIHNTRFREHNRHFRALARVGFE